MQPSSPCSARPGGSNGKGPDSGLLYREKSLFSRLPALLAHRPPAALTTPWTPGFVRMTAVKEKLLEFKRQRRVGPLIGLAKVALVSGFVTSRIGRFQESATGGRPSQFGAANKAR